MPAIDGALVWVACELRDVIAGGDHVIVTGEVIEVEGKSGRAAGLPRRRVPRRSTSPRTARAGRRPPRSARKKITRQLTAMIPISRRTIASATCLLALLGERLEVELAELLLGGAGAGTLGEKETSSGRSP